MSAVGVPRPSDPRGQSVNHRHQTPEQGPAGQDGGRPGEGLRGAHEGRSEPSTEPSCLLTTSILRPQKADSSRGGFLGTWIMLERLELGVMFWQFGWRSLMQMLLGAFQTSLVSEGPFSVFFRYRAQSFQEPMTRVLIYGEASRPRKGKKPTRDHKPVTPRVGARKRSAPQWPCSEPRVSLVLPPR